jgi:hypothetical protein
MNNILFPKAYNFALKVIFFYKCLSSDKKEFILSK